MTAFPTVLLDAQWLVNPRAMFAKLDFVYDRDVMLFEHLTTSSWEALMMEVNDTEGRLTAERTITVPLLAGRGYAVHNRTAQNIRIAAPNGDDTLIAPDEAAELQTSTLALTVTRTGAVQPWHNRYFAFETGLATGGTTAGAHRGDWLPGSGFPPGGNNGDTWTVAAPGGVEDGVTFATGDTLTQISDNPSLTTFAGSWAQTRVFKAKINRRVVQSGPDQGSVEETFNADGLTVDVNDVLLYKFTGAPAPTETIAFFQELNFTNPAAEGDPIGSMRPSFDGLDLVAQALGNRPAREGLSARFDNGMDELQQAATGITGTGNFWVSFLAAVNSTTGSNVIVNLDGGGQSLSITMDMDNGRLLLNYLGGFPIIADTVGSDFTIPRVYTLQWTGPNNNDLRAWVDGVESAITPLGGTNARDFGAAIAVLRARFTSIDWRLWSLDAGLGTLADAQRDALIANQRALISGLGAPVTALYFYAGPEGDPVVNATADNFELVKAPDVTATPADGDGFTEVDQGYVVSCGEHVQPTEVNAPAGLTLPDAADGSVCFAVFRDGFGWGSQPWPLMVNPNRPGQTIETEAVPYQMDLTKLGQFDILFALVGANWVKTEIPLAQSATANQQLANLVVNTQADRPEPDTVLVGTRVLVVNDPTPAANGEHIAWGAPIGQLAAFWRTPQ